MERTALLSCTRSLSACLKSTSCLTSAHCIPSQIFRPTSSRCLHATAPSLSASRPPKSRDRGPKSEEDTQTDFGSLDVLRNTAAPATAIDVCTEDGFAMNNGMRISGSGLLLIGGEAFRWRPWLREGIKENDGLKGRLVNAKGQWDVPEEAWGVLDLVWPKPDLLIIGTGPRVIPISPAVRRHLNDLGIRLEIQDTGNAAAQFNLLATERGASQVAAAMIPLGWKET